MLVYRNFQRFRDNSPSIAGEKEQFKATYNSQEGRGKLLYFQLH